MNITTTQVHGFKMLWDSDYSVINWAEHPDFEAFMRPILARNPGLFIDCGCNVGFHTLSAVSLEMDVIAIDANYRNAAMLQNTVELNKLTDKVTVLPVAVGDYCRAVSVDDTISNSKVGFCGVPVLQQTLNMIVECFSKGRTVSIIKMDLEGYESDAFKGAGQVIECHQPTVVFEHGLAASLDRSIFGTVADFGYDYRVIARHGPRYGEAYEGLVSNDPEELYMYEATPIRP